MGEAAAERGVETMARALAEEGPLTRAQLRERLDSAGVPTAGQALVHVLFYASLRGVCVRGPMVGKEHAFVLGAGLARADDAVRLAKRRSPSWRAATWSGTGRPTDADLARWAGLPLRDARAGLEAISAASSTSATASSTSASARSPRRSRRRACSAPSIPCCSAGPRASTSSASTSCW